MSRFEQRIQNSLDPLPYLEIARGTGTSQDRPFEDETISLRRARRLAVMDSLRSAFPQFFCELIPLPNMAEGLSKGVLIQAMSSNQLPDAASNIFRTPALATPSVASQKTVDSLRKSFLEKIEIADRADGKTDDWFYPSSHDPATESSECLYLILSCPELGASMVDQIDQRFIQDGDSDGLPEFVDAFGQPLRFIRWPTDYYAFWIDVTAQMETEYPSGVGPDDLYQKADYAQLLAEQGDHTDLLYSQNWFDAHRWRQWELDQAVFRQENATAWQILTYRTHQLYDIRQANREINLFLTPPVHFPATDFGFGLSTQQVTYNDDLSDFPRRYPTAPLIVSAGADRRFGLYTPEPGNLQGDRPERLPPPLPMWAALQLDYRCGRVDARHYRSVLDNIVNVELRAATGDLGRLPTTSR